MTIGNDVPLWNMPVDGLIARLDAIIGNLVFQFRRLRVPKFGMAEAGGFIAK